MPILYTCMYPLNIYIHVEFIYTIHIQMYTYDMRVYVKQFEIFLCYFVSHMESLVKTRSKSICVSVM